MYIDNFNDDIVTEDEMRDRLYDYISIMDIIDTMFEIGLSEIYAEMSDEQKGSIFDSTIERVIDEEKYFSKSE